MSSIVNIKNLKKKKLEKLIQSLKENKKVKIIPKSNFYEEAKLLITLSRILGCMPISFNKDGELEFKIFSKISIYSIFLQIFISVGTLIVLKSHWNNIKILDIHFDDKITFYGAAIYLGFYFLPVLSFIEGKKIVKYFTSWMNFEEKYHKATKKFLNYNMKKLQYLLFFIMFLDSILFVYFIHKLTKTLDIKYNLNYTKFMYVLTYTIYFYFLWVIHSCLALWYFLSSGIQKIAKILQNDLQDARLRNFLFDEIYELWLDLKYLTEDLGIAFSWTYLFYLAYMFIMMMGTSYSSFASMATSGADMKYGHLAFTLISTFAFALIADCAHRATFQVGDEFKNLLLKLLSDEQDPIIRREMKWFVQTMTLNSPEITLSGYVTLNRNFNVSMLGTLVTYIVVVLQFRST